MSFCYNGCEPKHGRPKQIIVWENGDFFSDGHCLTINPNYLRTWNAVLSFITDSIKPSIGAVRNLIHLESKEIIKSFDTLQANEKYIAVGNEKLKQAKNGYRCPTEKLLSISKRNLLDDEPSTSGVSTRNRRIILFIMANGKTQEMPCKVVLTETDIGCWSTILDYIARSLDIPEGIQFLYNVFGDKILNPRDLQNGCIYVAAAAKERFMELDYVKIFRNLLPMREIDLNQIARRPSEGPPTYISDPRMASQRSIDVVKSKSEGLTSIKVGERNKLFCSNRKTFDQELEPFKLRKQESMENNCPNQDINSKMKQEELKGLTKVNDDLRVIKSNGSTKIYAPYCTINVNPTANSGKSSSINTDQEIPRIKSKKFCHDKNQSRTQISTVKSGVVCCGCSSKNNNVQGLKSQTSYSAEVPKPKRSESKFCSKSTVRTGINTKNKNGSTNALMLDGSISPNEINKKNISLIDTAESIGTRTLDDNVKKLSRSSQLNVKTSGSQYSSKSSSKNSSLLVLTKNKKSKENISPNGIISKTLQNKIDSNMEVFSSKNVQKDIQSVGSISMKSESKLKNLDNETSSVKDVANKNREEELYNKNSLQTQKSSSSLKSTVTESKNNISNVLNEESFKTFAMDHVSNTSHSDLKKISDFIKGGHLTKEMISETIDDIIKESCRIINDTNKASNVTDTNSLRSNLLPERSKSSLFNSKSSISQNYSKSSINKSDDSHNMSRSFEPPSILKLTNNDKSKSVIKVSSLKTENFPIDNVSLKSSTTLSKSQSKVRLRDTITELVYKLSTSNASDVNTNIVRSTESLEKQHSGNSSEPNIKQNSKYEILEKRSLNAESQFLKPLSRIGILDDAIQNSKIVENISQKLISNNFETSSRETQPKSSNSQHLVVNSISAENIFGLKSMSNTETEKSIETSSNISNIANIGSKGVKGKMLKSSSSRNGHSDIPHDNTFHQKHHCQLCCNPHLKNKPYTKYKKHIGKSTHKAKGVRKDVKEDQLIEEGQSQEKEDALLENGNNILKKSDSVLNSKCDTIPEEIDSLSDIQKSTEEYEESSKKSDSFRGYSEHKTIPERIDLNKIKENTYISNDCGEYYVIKVMGKLKNEFLNQAIFEPLTPSCQQGLLLGGNYMAMNKQNLQVNTPGNTSNEKNTKNNGSFNLKPRIISKDTENKAVENVKSNSQLNSPSGTSRKTVDSVFSKSEDYDKSLTQELSNNILKENSLKGNSSIESNTRKNYVFNSKQSINVKDTNNKSVDNFKSKGMLKSDGGSSRNSHSGNSVQSMTQRKNGKNLEQKEYSNNVLTENSLKVNSSANSSIESNTKKNDVFNSKQSINSEDTSNKTVDSYKSKSIQKSDDGSSRNIASSKLLHSENSVQSMTQRKSGENSKQKENSNNVLSENSLKVNLSTNSSIESNTKKHDVFNSKQSLNSEETSNKTVESYKSKSIHKSDDGSSRNIASSMLLHSENSVQSMTQRKNGENSKQKGHLNGISRSNISNKTNSKISGINSEHNITSEDSDKKTVDSLKSISHNKSDSNPNSDSILQNKYDVENMITSTDMDNSEETLNDNNIVSKNNQSVEDIETTENYNTSEDDRETISEIHESKEIHESMSNNSKISQHDQTVIPSNKSSSKHIIGHPSNICLCRACSNIVIEDSPHMCSQGK